MNSEETKNFLGQIKRSKENIANLPKWMQEQMVYATASFPKVPKQEQEKKE